MNNNAIEHVILIGLSREDGKPMHRDEVITEVAASFNGFSVVDQVGYWNGQPEPSLAISIIDPAPRKTPAGNIESTLNVNAVANVLRATFRQESVWVKHIPINLTTKLGSQKS